MSADRYMKIVLTVIALELGWIAVKDTAVEVSAQQKAAEPMPVIIRGVEPEPGKPGSLPVTLSGSTTTVRVLVPQPLVVETGSRPLLIQSVPAVGAKLPGE